MVFFDDNIFELIFVVSIPSASTNTQDRWMAGCGGPNGSNDLLWTDSHGLRLKEEKKERERERENLPHYILL